MQCKITCQTTKIINLATKGRALLLQECLHNGEGCMACSNRNNDNLLIVATKHGHVNVVQILLTHFPGDYKERFNKTGKRALHEAAQNNRHDVAEFLLQQGADVNSLKQGDWTALMLAAEKRNLEIVELLVDYGADVTLTNKDGWNAFHIAARSGSADILNYLHKTNHNMISTVSKNGRTPLHSAALNDSREATGWLLKHGILPDVVDSSGLTPLMDGARMGHEAVCSLLLSHGADILKRDSLARTALHHVTQAGQLEMIDWCIGKAELKLPSQPRSLARTKSVNRKVNTLRRSISAGDLKQPGAVKVKSPSSFVNWSSQQGSTALHYAAKEARYMEIRALLKFGADKSLRDNFGRLPGDMTNNDNVKVLLT